MASQSIHRVTSTAVARSAARPLMERIDGDAVPIVPAVLEVAGDTSWFRVGGAPAVRCDHRPVMRRVLAELVREAIDRPGVALDLDRILGAGWPGEKMRRASARRRIQVMVGRMRDMGLRGVLETTDAGYRIVPRYRVVQCHDAR